MPHDHPELPTEQARIDAIYLEAEKKLEHLRTPVAAGINSDADAALRRLRDASARELQQAIEREEGIVFARADFIDENDPIYLGVQGVAGLSHDQLVVDYRSPFGERYYRATRSQPLGIRRRRTIAMQRRTVRSIVDEHLVAPCDAATSALNQVERSLSGRNAAAAEASPDVVVGRRRRSRRSRSTDSAASDSPEPDVWDVGANDASPSEDGIAEPVAPSVDPEQQQLFADHHVEVRGRDLLLAELESERTGRMRHVVATIQADQDRLIRADRNQPLLIQGGPGTGKTIVGLHRAAQILYDLRQQRDLTARSSVLIVGPNRRFMDYVARVLPSLGERDVDQMTIDELLLRAATGTHDVRIAAGDEGVVSALLGHRRMATLVVRAVWAHASPSPLQVKLPSSTIELTVDEVQGIIDELRLSGRSYDDARIGLAQRLVAALVRRYRDRHEARSGSAPMAAEVADVERRLNERISGGRIADRVLPRVAAEDLVVRLREDVGFLRAVAADVLTESSMRAILRRGPRQSGQFTSAELPLLDEARSIISGGTKRYAHVIVDEAQDISPMQWRAIRRRVSGGAVTLLGDLAQGTRPWSPYSWETVIEALELSGVRYGELRLNYRVPEPIAAYADTVLRRIDVVSAPVRHLRTGAPVAWEELADWADSSRSAADRIRRCLVDVEGSVGMIAPSRHHGRLEAALRDANEDLRSRVTLLDPGEAKGLEYDNVVLVDPDAIERLPRGERLLYVAATRATKRLFMVTNRREEDPAGDSTADSRDDVPVRLASPEGHDDVRGSESLL